MKGQLSQRASSTVCLYSNPLYSDEADSKFGDKTIASFDGFSVKRDQQLASLLLSHFIFIYFKKVLTYNFYFL